MKHEQFGHPKHLVAAREMAHAAVQLLHRTAVANLQSEPGDEHSNLGWNVDRQAFETHALNSAGGAAWVCLSPFALGLSGAALPLEGVSLAQAQSWLDTELKRQNLHPSSPAPLAYALPKTVAKVEIFQQEDGLRSLAAWYSLASSSLEQFINSLKRLAPGPSPLRCWPHHFDLATYVGLEPGPAETARGIGVGLSPGDETYNQPYFYVNPWPHLEMDKLPMAVPPGRWHVDGFVGSIATGEDILSLDDLEDGTQKFLIRSFEAGYIALGM